MTSIIRPLVSKMSNTFLSYAAKPLTNYWNPNSYLFLISGQKWVLAGEIHELTLIAKNLGIKIAPFWLLPAARNQSVFYSSRHFLLGTTWKDQPNRIAFPYYHGLPGCGSPNHDRIYQNLCNNHEKIHRIQVSHSEMRDIILESGISFEKVSMIPIGINLSYFKKQTKSIKNRIRKKLNIPKSAIVIGSFQKDGVGWGEGLEPKLIKGPDVFLKVIGKLKEEIPELFVLLTGPTRGYVKKGLTKLNVPFKHCYIKHYPSIGELYQVLDVYIISSRQEGGPKAVLESMASGIPLVTTRVGQAMDLVKHTKNGWMVDVEDVEGLAHWAKHAIENTNSINDIILSGRKTAEENSYEAQILLWKNFMDGFVNF